MKILKEVKESWSEVTFKEILGWIVFTGVFSLLMMKSTIFWEMGRDKLEVSYLIYRVVMTVLFVSMTAVTMKFAFKWIQQEKNEVEERELIRVFTGQLFFASLLIGSIVIEAFSMSIRGSQLVEYLQGLFYFGIGTGFGMMFYLVAINHIPKKDREPQADNAQELQKS